MDDSKVEMKAKRDQDKTSEKSNKNLNLHWKEQHLVGTWDKKMAGLKADKMVGLSDLLVEM